MHNYKKIRDTGIISLEDKLVEAKGRPSGFDYMRLILAISVVSFHAIIISYGGATLISVWASHWRIALALILPMFFSLSGFLVAGSLERSKTLITFLGLRILRIVPALAGEVILSALILGPLVTTNSYEEYFSNSQFFTYFLNILGDIHYNLPGVFLSNPIYEKVNGQLWTVPFELLSYLVLALLSVTGIFMRRYWLLLFMIGFYIVQIANTVFRPRLAEGTPGGVTLVMMFVGGLVVYRYRDKIAWNCGLFLISFIIVLSLLVIPNGDRFIAMPAAYATAYLGLLNPPRNKILLSGDYSYGIFLYSFPLQQMFASIGPATQHWYWNILFMMPPIAGVATLSWWFIEKPSLGLKRHLKKLENWYLQKIH